MHDIRRLRRQSQWLFVILCLSSIPLVLAACAGMAWAQTAAANRLDIRAAVTRHLDMTYPVPEFRSLDEWRARRSRLRMQLLMAAGLWPMPEKTPLNARIFDRLDRSGYSVEKVYFESFPGFYVTGNLYRPRGKTGPFPAVLLPHGHFAYGRLQNTELASFPAQGISFARQGYIAFTYDMVGYNDSRQVDHRFAGEREALWDFGSLGLHTWNSIRCLDFLESLEDVDRTRLACTGASGGGTQTFLLTAIDERVMCSAPVNMISAYMQGGDVCENAPGLRIDTNNMEIGAMMAPRPMMMVSATGDWTKNTLEVEYPAIRRIYELYGAGDKVSAVRVQAEHNYNQESREQVYRWFSKWVLGKAAPETYREKDISVPMPSDVLVFYGRPMPEGALLEKEVAEDYIRRADATIEKLKPRGPESWETFRNNFEPALRYCLMVEEPKKEELEIDAVENVADKTMAISRSVIGRKGKGDRVPITQWSPVGKRRARAAVLVLYPDGAPAGQSGSALDRIVQALVAKGCTVMVPDLFNTGRTRFERKSNYRYFTCYNRTDEANRVQDILTSLVYLRSVSGELPIRVSGLNSAGLWTLLARGLATIAADYAIDADAFEAGADMEYLKRLNIPGLRRAGDFRSAAVLNVAGQLWIHNTAPSFPSEWITSVFSALQKSSSLRIQKSRAGDDELLAWIQPDTGSRR